jgi:large subunit ribosomal protein L10
MARPDKVAAVAEIAERFNDSDATLLTEYRGLKVSEIAEVRNALREANAEYKVLKNTLARIAVKEVGYEDLAETLTGPTAIVFVKGDVVAAAKALDEASKKFPVLLVKGGALKGGKLISADDAKALAKLESREVLLTKIAMMLNQPAQLTVNVFAALLRDLGSMLAQVQAKKESGELPGGPGASADGDSGARVDAEGDAAGSPSEEEIGVPNPDGEDAEAQAESAEESDNAPEPASDEDGDEDGDTSDSSSSDDPEDGNEEE